MTVEILSRNSCHDFVTVYNELLGLLYVDISRPYSALQIFSFNAKRIALTFGYIAQEF